MSSFYLSPWSYKRKAVVLVLAFLCLRVIVSSFLNFGNDESYYWTFSKKLQWNYFDHPPLVAVWIRVFTANLMLEDYTFFLRLGSFVGSIFCSFFIYKTIAAIATEKAGFVGVFLYNISLYSFISTGMFIIPDTPQMVFWTMSMYLITKIIKDDLNITSWIFFGITAGLCIMSKVHGIFLWGGIILYAFFYKKEWFKNYGLYTSMFITAVIISPILIWNINNDFITYRFHSERVALNEKSTVHFMGVLREVIGQILINNPFNIVLIFLFFFKRFTSRAKATLQVFKWIGLSLLLVIFIIAIFRNTLPHWSGPAYISLLPIAAIGLSEINFSKVKIVMASAFFYTLLLLSLMVIAVNFYAGSFSTSTGKNLGKSDISLDAYGWKEGGEKFANYYNTQHTSPNKPPMVCNTWWGGHDEYYFARPLNIKMIGLAPVLSIHQYKWRLSSDTVNLKMDTAYTVVHSYDYFNAPETFKNYYYNIDSVNTISIKRGGKVAYQFYIWKLTGWKGFGNY